MKLPFMYKTFRDRWEQYQQFWMLSDCHFDDVELREGMRVQGRWRPNDEEIVNRINQKVGKKDIFCCLGDVGNPEWIKKIRAGYKILLLGNHDAGVANYQDYFDEIYEGPIFVGEKIAFSHEPLDFTFVKNIHGHVHQGKLHPDKSHINICADVVDYKPLSLGELLYNSPLSDIQSLHRQTINTATKRKENRK